MAPAELANEPDVLAYVRQVPGLVERFEGLAGAECRLIHVGPLNRVFEIRKGGEGLAVVKQALPYLRVGDEEWPLEHRHALFERRALEIHASLCPGLAPEIYHSDVARGLLVLEHLGALRPFDGYVEEMGGGLPRQDDIVRFCSETLFRTSDFYLTTEQKMVLVEFFAPNMELASFLHRRLIVEPFAPDHLRDHKHFVDVLEQATCLSHAFLTRQEALCHGGLTPRHLLTDGRRIRIISPTYAFIGPVAFDLGTLTAHILRLGMLNDNRLIEPAMSWIGEFWREFSRQYVDLWRQDNHGDATPAELFHLGEGAEVLESYRTSYVRDMFGQALGFTGCEVLAGAAHTPRSSELRTRLESAGFRCILASGQGPGVESLTEILTEP